MLEGFIPNGKRLLLVALTLCAFFVSAQLASAGSIVFPPDFDPPFVNDGDNPGNPNAPGYFPTPGGGSGGDGDPDSGGGPGGDGDGGSPTTPTGAPPETPIVTVTDSPSCWSSGQGFLNCLLVSFFGSIVAVAGYTFDAAISMFIVGFGDLYINAGIGATVERVWTTVRDVFNLTFIFGLVYIGFQIILGTNESSAKRTLPLLILAALLVNFSLFVVKFIVDFANLAAIQIFNLFTIGDQATPSADSPVDILILGGSDAPSISLAFINTIGVTGLLNHTANTAEGVPIFYTFGMIIVFLVLTYVFFAGAILITIRFAVLIFYMIFSPVMFLGWVFPGFKSYSDKFWNGLFGQAFFAPALLFMLYVSYQLAQGFNDGNRVGGEGIHSDPDNIAAFAAFMPYLVVIVIFIVASLVVARKMASQGASMVGKVNDWGIGKLNGALRGGGGMLAGSAGQYGYKNIDKMANSDNRLARGIGRTLTFTGARDKAEKAYKGSVQGKWQETRKKRSGEMATRKSDADVKSAIKRYSSLANPGDDILLQTAVRGGSTDQIMSVLRSYKVGDANYNNIVDSLTHEQRKKILESTDDKVSATERNQIGGRASAKIQSDIDSGRTDISKLTPKQIDVMGRKWIMDNFDSLTNSQVEKLASDSTVLGESEKSTFKKAWGDELERKYNTAGAGGFDFSKYLSGKTAKDVAAYPAAILTDIGAVPYLTDKVLREIAVSNMSTSDRAAIKANVTTLGGSSSSYFSPTNNHSKNNW